MPQGVRIYHNPSCSKSRAALDLLRDRDVGIEEVRYLEDPPTADELRGLVTMLGVSPRDLLRTGEPKYAELGLDDADDDALLAAMAANPVLIERPIVVAGGRAVIGRPPEKVLDLL